MPTQPDKMIPELILKLKNALETGEPMVQNKLNEESCLDLHLLEQSSRHDTGEQSACSDALTYSNIF